MFRARTTERPLLPRLVGLPGIDPRVEEEAAAYVAAPA